MKTAVQSLLGTGLNADHLPIDYILSKSFKGVPQYDLVIVILPKKLENYDSTILLNLIKSIGKKVTLIKEGPLGIIKIIIMSIKLIISTS